MLPIAAIPAAVRSVISAHPIPPRVERGREIRCRTGVVDDDHRDDSDALQVFERVHCVLLYAGFVFIIRNM